MDHGRGLWTGSGGIVPANYAPRVNVGERRNRCVTRCTRNIAEEQAMYLPYRLVHLYHYLYSHSLKPCLYAAEPRECITANLLDPISGIVGLSSVVRSRYVLVMLDRR